MRRKLSERISSIILYGVMIFLAFVTLYPFWHVIMYSISDPIQAMGGGIFLYPRGFSLIGYQTLFKTKQIFTAYGNSLFLLVVGTSLNVVFTALLAYPLSIQRFKGRNAITMMVFFTMLFSGGMIPNYLLVDALGLLNSRWALILPGLISAWNTIVMKNYFQSIPASLEESASIDGASPLVILVRIIVPVSMPVIATVALWCAVGHWNNYFNVVLYIFDLDKQTLPIYLRSMLASTAMDQATQSGVSFDTAAITPETMKMSTIVASVLPMLIIYPFIQKYFIKGIMVGSIKG
ncbi:MAG: carbohydrate ABC transporter permease [Christensenellales bacterium]|jgi:putative aldouronate transport system permease protein